MARRAASLATLPLLLLTACGDSDPAQPESLRFGQVGEIRLQLVTPLAVGEGELQQALTWNSSGVWQLYESIAYLGTVGEESLVRDPGDPGAYATFITLLNETPSLDLRVPELDNGLIPDCGASDTRVSLLIRDDARSEEVRWVRCSSGSLGGLETSGAGPDPQASRVIQAARLIRDFTLGSGWVSTYFGSVPFATLDRGVDSGAALEGPLVFIGTPGLPDPEPDGWRDFWERHTGSDEPPPEVDWLEQMVVVGAVGRRFEAGDSVEVRRILRGQESTLVDLYQRVPGDFCSPAALAHTPFHIVLAPRAEKGVRFNATRTERVPCGG